MTDQPFSPAQMVADAKFEDKLINLVTSLGTSRSKLNHTDFVYERFSRETYQAMYANDWASGKIIDIPIEDMLRNWFTTITEPAMTPEELTKFEEEERRLQVKKNVSEGMRWGRLYGGCLVVMGIDGAGEHHEPLDLERVKEGSLKFLHVLDRHDISVHQVNTWKLEEENYRMPEIYELHGGLRVHHSRVMRFDGLDLPWDVRKRENYWGLPVLSRLFEAINNSQSVANSVANLLQESNIDVIKVQGLFQKLSGASGGAGVKQISDRFELGNLLKSTQNMLLIDKDQEEYEKTFANFANLDKLIHTYLQFLAAAADIPATRFLGMSPGGLNSTGDGDLENYYNKVESDREDDLVPELLKLYNIIYRSCFGKSPDTLKFKWKPLWQMSEQEEAEVEKTRSETRKTYFDMGILTRTLIGKQLQHEESYVALDGDHLEVLKAADEMSDEESEEMHNRVANGEDPEGGTPGGSDPGDGDNDEISGGSDDEPSTTKNGGE